MSAFGGKADIARQPEPTGRDRVMKVLTKIALLTTVLFGGTAEAQISDGVIKIGVLGDMSSIYADLGGPGSVVAARRSSP
jgi:hypothetical protein